MMNCSKTSQPRSSANVISRLWRLAAATALILLLVCSLFETGLAAQTAGSLSPQAVEQINALVREKQARTPVQRKMSSRLIYAIKMSRGEPIAAGVPTLQVTLPDVNARGAVLDVRTEVTDSLLNDLRLLGAEIIHVSAAQRSVRLRIDVQQAEAIAALPEVSFVQPKQEATTMRLDPPSAGPLAVPARATDRFTQRKQAGRAALVSSVQEALASYGPVASVGSTNSQGDATHKANVARSAYGVSGAGVKVGVLSDGIAGLAASQALGDLGAVTVLAGQAGPANGAEGTAMLEIIHDLAPDAQLYFASAFISIGSFADNIRALRAAGCDIIVDDVAYYVESPFQDGQTYTSPTNGGIVAQAVKDVVASGALYFSSAANSGNKNDGQSGTWEGDFVDAGAAGAPLVGAGTLHSFGGQPYNVLTASSDNPILLFWSDPLGGSDNDYDLYLLNAAGTAVIGASADLQDGDDDPVEGVEGGIVNERIVVVRYSGDDRFLHLGTNRNRLQISTGGETHGHAATTALNSFGVAATPAAAPFTTGAPPGPFPNPFNGGNKVETFSSDGPRRLFFTGAGVAFTPGNLLGSGGLLLQKPDITAADGVSVTGSGGFPTTFYGTSAAAPHAAAIAALMKSKNLAVSATQIRIALLSSAIDIEAAGIDPDSGVGIIMADAALQAISKASDYDYDGDGKADLTVFQPASGAWYTLRSSSGYTSYSQAAWGDRTDIPVAGDYDGDRKADIAVYRPGTGTWYVLQSSTNFASYVSYQWGNSTDIPVARDYDGDGKADIAIYRPSNGTWWVLTSGSNYASYITYQWGGTGDVPLPRDYDGDGKADFGIYRPATGAWWVLTSTTGYTNYFTMVWGVTDDIPVPADYDGDGKTDLAVFRPSSGDWWIVQGTGYVNYTWGFSGDVLVPADYDGDGKADVAIYRPSTGTWWWLLSSTAGTTYGSYQFGNSGDVPVR